jgi:flagellar motor switch protein FliG
MLQAGLSGIGWKKKRRLMKRQKKENGKMSDPQKLSNLDRAAIIYKTLGDNLSVSLFRHLSQAQLNKLRRHAETLTKVPFELKRKVLEEYYFQLMSEKIKIFSDGEQKVLFDFLKPMSSDQIRYLLEPESELVKALVLSQLDMSVQVEVIKNMEEDERARVLIQMNDIEQIPYEGIINIENDIRDKARLVPHKAHFNKGGSKQIADILSQLEPNFEEQFVSHVQNEDPDLARDLAKYYVPFESFDKLPLDVLREALKSVELQDLALALKGMEEEFVKFIIGNLPQKTQIMLEDEIKDAEGPQPRRKVETARRKLVQSVKQLASEGKFDIEDFLDTDMIE